MNLVGHRAWARLMPVWESERFNFFFGDLRMFSLIVRVDTKNYMFLRMICLDSAHVPLSTV